MSRIPDAELERLKREVSLLRLIESQGHELKKRGKDWVMRCVFHAEDKPSFAVSEAKNVYHCFGCGASGTVLDWVMKTQGVSLPHAVQLQRNDAPISSAEKVGVVRSHARYLPSLAADADEQVLLRQVAELPPQTRCLLKLLQAWVSERCAATAQKQSELRFTRRDVREATHWGDTQLKVHLARLVELESVLSHRGLRGLTYEYELRYDGADDGRPHLMGLLELDNDAERSGQSGNRSGSGRAVVGARSGWGDQAQGPMGEGHPAELVGVVGDAYSVDRSNAPSLARVV